MKKIIFIALGFCLWTNLYAVPNETNQRFPKLLKFIADNQNLRNYALYSLISKRCTHYMNFSEVGACKNAVKLELQFLDYDIILTDASQKSKDTWAPSAFVFVAFKNNLINILTEDSTNLYLEQLRQGLNRYLTGEERTFNIWDFTLAFYKSKILASKVMAALFQDTSLAKLHLAYLERSGTHRNVPFHSNKEKLSQVIDTINLILDYSEDHYRELFYPKELRTHLNRNIYHFYVPLYLAMALEDSGLEKKYAHAGPLMLTLTYEFITASKDYKYLLSDPQRLDPVAYLGKLKDIFGGHAGASFGVGQAVQSSLFPLLKEAFARSSEDGVYLLLNP